VILPLRELPTDPSLGRDYVATPLVKLISASEATFESVLQAFITSLVVHTDKFVVMPLVPLPTTGTGAGLKFNAIVTYVRLS
jgi:hypothetical protein